MPPILALLICILLILYLLWADRNNTDGVSGAIWIPLIWMLIVGSRFISQWLNPSTPVISVNVDPEGSPLDRAVFLILMFSAAGILIRRKLNWGELFTKNSWMWIFFIFGAASILWSDYPFVSFKRWSKALGNVLMVLVILTEKRPYDAVGLILRRFSILLLPLSVLFIKYYPHLGRAYHMGNPMFTGVSDHKNGLGQICMVSGIYFSWSLLLNRWDKNGTGLPKFPVIIMILPMIAWLFYMANSATSMTCMFITFGLFILGRQPGVARNPRRVLTLGFALIGLFGVLEFFFGFSETVIALLNRRQDLTTRVPMWRDLLATVRNPIIGFGYESFWLGDRRDIISERWGIFGQAHNGYLQVYLDLGLIGLFILVAWILSGLKNIANYLTIDYPSGILRLSFIVVVIFYNWTEATFYGPSLMWSLFLLGCMDIPGHAAGSVPKRAMHGRWRSISKECGKPVSRFLHRGERQAGGDTV